MPEHKSADTVGLHRSSDNRIIAGVCGGLGDFFNIDPTIIRIVFIFLAFFGGSGIFIYIILWIIIPVSRNYTNPQEYIRANMDEMKEQMTSFAHDIRSNSPHHSRK